MKFLNLLNYLFRNISKSSKNSNRGVKTENINNSYSRKNLMT